MATQERVSRSHATSETALLPERSLLRLALQAWLIGLVTLLPWCLGGARPSFQAIAAASGLAVLPIWWALCWQEGRLPEWRSPVGLALAAAIGLGIFQFVPLPAGLWRELSPRISKITTSQFIAARDAAENGADWVTVGGSYLEPPQILSLLPAETRRHVALLALVLIVFWAGSQLLRRSAAMHIFCGIMGANGALLAIVGLLQKFSGSQKLAFIWDNVNGGRAFSSFVNRNNAGGFLLLTLACALAFASTQRSRRGNLSGDRLSNGEPVQRTTFSNLLGWLMVVCICLGILATLSRGAVVAMAASLAVFVVFRRPSRQGHQIAWMAGACGLAIAMAVWSGQFAPLQERFGKVLDPDELETGRLALWKDCLAAVPDLFLVGSGMGSFRVAHRLYQTRAEDTWFMHAENEYLEAFFDGGILGLGLIAILLLAVMALCWKLMRFANKNQADIYVVLGAVALAGQVVQTMFDFSLHTAANCLLFAAIVGALTGRHTHLEQMVFHGAKSSRRSTGSRMFVTGLFAVVSMALVGGALFQLGRSAAIEKADALPVQVAWSEVPVEDLERTVRQLDAALKNEPDDAIAHIRAGTLHVEIFRLKATGRKHGRDPESREDETEPDAATWDETAPSFLRQYANQLIAVGKVDSLRSDPLVQAHLVPAWEHFQAARRHCRLFAGADVAASELSFLGSDQVDVAPLLSVSLEYMPGQSGLLFRSGVMGLGCGDNALARDSFRQCLKITPMYDQAILNLCSTGFSAIAIAQDVIPAEPKRFAEVMEAWHEAQPQSEGRRAAVRWALTNIARLTLENAEQEFLRGLLLFQSDELGLAEKHLRSAVSNRPDRVHWKATLARVLAAQGKTELALGMLEDCLRKDPDNSKYKGWMRALSGKPTSQEPDK